jgi:uncharacterized membrane protein
MCCRLQTIQCGIALFGTLTALGGLVILGLTGHIMVRLHWINDIEDNTVLHSTLLWLTIALFIIGGFTVIMGGIGSILGSWAVSTSNNPSRFCVSCYGFWLIVLILAMVAVAFPILSMYFSKPEDLTAFCNGSLEESKYFQQFLDQSQALATKVDDGVSLINSDFICRSECPCKEVEFTKWSIEMQQELQKPRSRGGEYDFSGDFDKFETCFAEKSILWTTDEIPLTENPTLSIIEALETNLECSGICNAGVFWLYKDVTLGPPTQTCLEPLFENFNSTAGWVGLAVVASAVCAFFVFLTHFGLYRKKKYEVIAPKRKFITTYETD